MEGGRNQNRGTESTSTSTQQPARGTAPPTTNLPATIPMELLEQMFKTLRPDVDVAQTLAYLAQNTQPSTSAAAQVTITIPAQPIPSATEGLTGDGGRTQTEGTEEAVEKAESPQGPIQPGDEDLEIRGKEKGTAATGEARSITEVPEGDAAHADKGKGTTEGASNEEQSHPEGGEIILLQIDDFLGQPATPLPTLSPPAEMSHPEEEVPLLERPSRSDELQIIDLDYDSGTGKDGQKREKKRKGKLLAQPRVKKDKR